VANYKLFFTLVLVFSVNFSVFSSYWGLKKGQQKEFVSVRERLFFVGVFRAKVRTSTHQHTMQYGMMFEQKKNHSFPAIIIHHPTA
jgi:hypothetical protein